MGIFSNIWDRITGKKDRDNAAKTTPGGGKSAPTVTKSAPGAAPEPVDVEAVLEGIAASRGGGGNWRTSIVDLLKMLDMDSSLDARKELAEELNVKAGPHGSAEQNIALSKAVWAAMERNGGKVPPSLKD